MPVELERPNDDKLLVVRATGRLEKADYEQFTPAIEQLIEKQGKIRVLFETHDFHGWTAGALWDDIKFDVKHFNDIERLAIVGDKTWEQAMAAFCKPFTTAAIRYFSHDDADAARQWLESE